MKQGYGRRKRKLKIYLSQFVDMLKSDIIYRVTRGLPDDAEIIKVIVEKNEERITFILFHESFEPYRGNEIPEIICKGYNYQGEDFKVLEKFLSTKDPHTYEDD